MPQNSVPNDLNAVIPAVIAIGLAICSVLGAAFTALCKWTFMTKKECEQLRDRCNEHCREIRKTEEEMNNFKLDKIYEEIKISRSKFEELCEFMGDVKRYMKDHCG
jgi:uncharacterized membrane protein (DUF106 family)